MISDFEKMEYLRKNVKGVVANIDDSTLVDFERYMHNRSAKLSRLRLRLFLMLRDNSYVYFCSQSFADEALQSLNNLKATICKRFQRSGFNDYVYNYDYGESKGRLHFHAIIASSVPLYGLFDDLGNVDIQLIDRDCLNSKSFEKLSAYTSRHAIKVSAEVANLHYKRGVYSTEDFKRGRIQYLKRCCDLYPDNSDYRIRLWQSLHKFSDFQRSGSRAPRSDSERAADVLQHYDFQVFNYEAN